MQQLDELKKLLADPKRVVITTHHKPDADALGSSLGLANFLNKRGHQAQVITPTDYPKFLHWMKGNDEVMIFNEGHEEESAQLVKEADIIFCLDFSRLDRIDKLGELVRAADAYKALIDHHQDPEHFAEFELWDTGSASTCQLIYKLIVALGDRGLIDTDIANCLYAGIMTDTGSFKHPNTNKEVHEIVADLIGLGAENSKVSRLVYDNSSLNRLRFLGFALNERLKVLEEYHTAYFAISAEDLKKFHSQTGDTEGLVNYALSIEGVVMAALITEREDAVKLSFRSVGDVEVNKLASEFFQGGGHKNAAGGKSDLNFKETVEKFEKLVKEKRDILVKQNLVETHA